MSNIESIINAVDFIEENLQQEISVGDIADSVFFSIFHFCRTFNKIVGHSPYDYLMRRRISESAKNLLNTNKKIIDIAFDYQFNSPETYSRAFKRVFGLPPNQWKKRCFLNRRQYMPRITQENLRHVNKGEFLKPKLIEKETFFIEGLSTQADRDPAIIQDLWHVFKDLRHTIRNKVQPKKYHGISFCPSETGNQAWFYMAAVEVNSLDNMNLCTTGKKIPAMTCASFIHKGPIKDLNFTLDYIYHTWLPKSGYALSSPIEIESYGSGFNGFDTEDSELEVHIPIV